MNKMLSEMTGEELAEVLREMADRVQETVNANETIVERLRETARDLESRRQEPNA